MLDLMTGAGSKRDEVNLVVVVPSMSAGGMERCASILLQHFGRKGIRPQLVTIFDREPFYRIPPDVPVHVLERYSQPPAYGSLISQFPRHAARLSNELNWFEATAYKLALLLQKQQPDVILSQGFYASLIVLISRHQMPRDIKIIASLHNQKSVFLPMSPYAGLYEDFIRHFFNDADSVVTVSRGIAQDGIDNYGLLAEKAVVIHNPLDLEQIGRLALAPVTEHTCFSEDAPVLLFVGRLTRQKGLDCFLRAVALARRDIELRCVLVGDGELRPELEALARQLGITQEVVLLGQQTNPFKFMRRADCLILPSVVEGLPYVIAEAMACGCPIIATDCAPGVRELLADGARGLLIPPGDPHALAEAISRVLRDDRLREKFHRAGIRHAQEFAVDKIVSQYEQLIKAHAGIITP